MKQKNNRSFPFYTWLVLLCAMILLSSCAMPVSTQSKECRGFPFDKEFPGDDHRPINIYYDRPYAWFTGKDGLRFRFYYRHRQDRKHKLNLYNATDLPHSEREKNYLAGYRKREQEFDRRYAGWIKKKLLATSDWVVNDWKNKTKLVMKQDEFNRVWLSKVKAGLIKSPGAPGRQFEGSFTIKYPRYLIGDKLPEGLQTPASFFSPHFFWNYVMAGDRQDVIKYNKHGKMMYNYIKSQRFSPRFEYMEAALATGGDMANNVKQRFQIIFAEYVLTHYYLKQYPSKEEREQAAMDLADYYGEVAFRAAAEAGYKYRQILRKMEWCGMADFVARRVHDYIIIAITDPNKLQEIRQEYEGELADICYGNIASTRTFMDEACFADKKCRKERWAKNQEIRRKIEENEEKCVND